MYFLTDVFGHTFLNNQLLADEFAQKGKYYVVMPDLFDGDSMKVSDLNKPLPAGVDRATVFKAWKSKHEIQHVEKILGDVSAEVQSQYAPKFNAAVGYCFGAKYAIRMLGASPFLETSKVTLQSAAIFHPSLVENEEVKLISTKSTLLIVAADNDHVYTAEVKTLTESTLKDLEIKYRTVLLQGAGHGFAVRGNINDPWIKFAKEQAFLDAVDWFKLTEANQ